MKKLLLILLAIALALSFGLIACGGAGEEEEEEEEEEGPEYGGVLTIISVTGPPWSLGYPLGIKGAAEVRFVLPCVETLLRKDAEGMLEPWLATDWEISPDFESITLTLRQGVKFHDGTDFNAEAVKYNLDIWINSVKPDLQMVESIDIVNDYTVRLNLSQFDSDFLGNLAGAPGLMISPTAVETMGEEWCTWNPVGTGPFKFLSFERDVSLRYERFDDYWQEGKPYLDGWQEIYIGNQMVGKAVFLAGEGQVIQPEPATVVELQETGNYYIAASVGGGTTVGLAGDSANPDSPFADIRVRQAVEYAINKQAIADAVTYGLSEAVNQPFAPGEWPYNPNIVGYPYDPQKARELLAEAAADGVFEPNDLGGFDTRIIFPSIGNFPDIFTAVSGYLSEVGINAELEMAGFALFAQYVETGWEDGLIWITTAPGYEGQPLTHLRSFLSSQGTIYQSIMHPADYEDKLALAAQEPDQDAKKALIQEVMRLIVDEYCMVTSICRSGLYFVTTTNVHDLGVELSPFFLYTPEAIWISGEKPGWGEYKPPPAELDWSDMPIYTGAEQTEQGTWQIPPPAPGGWTQEELRFYATEDSSSDVASFYQSAMLDNGWEEMMALENFMGMDYILIYNKNNEQDGAEVLIGAHEGKTYICLKRQAK